MNSRKIALSVLLAGVMAVSCTKDLNRSPETGLSAETLYKNEAGYRSSLAKIYGGLALTGNQGPSGSGDLGGIDEGFSSYLRNLWNLEELPTDEAVIAWNDETIKDLHEMDWTPADVFLRAIYSRIYYQITLANAFIRESSDDKLTSRNITGADATKVKGYQAEARLLRALSYWHAMDLFGNPTFVTENDPIGAFLPPRISRDSLFTFIETELKAITPQLPAPKQNEYGRADRAAAWMILANLYLNAGVYTTAGPRYADAVKYADSVIAGPYDLEKPNYANLFLADNNKSIENIFMVTFDGNRTRTWGGTTYLIHAPVGGDMVPADFGIDGGWGGLRTTKAFVQKFSDPSGSTDKRAMFQSAGQTLEINDISEFRQGYSIRKWKNKTSTGVNGSNLTWTDTDYPIFRLAEAYLIYAEAVLRDPASTAAQKAQATGYINELRERAYGNTTGNITQAQMDLNFILDERARELYWEGKRRTDLIRYNLFTTSSYLWPWKGGVKDGTAVSPDRVLYPIPSAEINTNPNLRQNKGY